MPRISPHEHFRRHRFLRMVFTGSGMQLLFALLPLSDQYELHRYYATDHDFTAEQFDAYRRAQDQAEPSLRNRVGKHFKVIEENFLLASRSLGITPEQTQQAIRIHNQKERAVAAPAMTKKGTPRKQPASSRARLLPIAKPLDLKGLSHTFLALAEWQIRKEERVERGDDAA